MTDIAEQDSLEELRHKFAMFVSHATGGRTSDTSLPLNTLSVMATQKVNDVWNHALEKGRSEAADTLSQMRDALAFYRREWREDVTSTMVPTHALYNDKGQRARTALTTTKIEKDAQPAVECKMPNCSDEAVWMGLCQHHREWVQGR